MCLDVRGASKDVAGRVDVGSDTRRYRCQLNMDSALLYLQCNHYRQSMIQWRLPAIAPRARYICTPVGLFSFGCLLLVLACNIWYTRLPISHSAFWLRDGGLVLQTAENCLSGKRLYLDTFYQYGSLPITMYGLAARLFGNSISTFSWYLLVVHLACCALLVQVLKVSRCPVGPMAVTTLAVLSVSLLPLGLQYTWEQLLTLCVMAVWQPPFRRRFGRNLSIGILLGLMQFVRFGAIAGPMIGLVAADLLSTYVCQRSVRLRAIARTLGLSAAAVLLGIAAAESGLLIQVFLTLPRDVAKDVAWPHYMLHSFDAYAAVDLYPRWLSLNYFLEIS